MEKVNSVLLRRKNSVFVKPVSINVEPPLEKKALVATFVKNISAMGYTLKPELAQAIVKLPREEIINITKGIEDDLKKSLNADVEYLPMYPGFPESVINRSETTLFWDSVVYAMSGFTALPYDAAREAAAKTEAANYAKLKPIGLAKENEIFDIASNLMSSQVAFSPEDKDDLSAIYEYDKAKFKKAIPASVPNKENLVWLAVESPESAEGSKNAFIEKIKTAQDLLRVMVARCGGDPSLVNVGKLHRMPRSEAKAYAEKLARIPNAEADLYRHRDLLKRVAEINHFRDSKDPKVNKMLDRLYSNTGERSFLSKRDALIKEGNFNDLMGFYTRNPGQMGADLVMLARLAESQPNPEEARSRLVASFKENAKKMSKLNLLKATEALKAASQPDKGYSIYSPSKGLSNPYLRLHESEPVSEKLYSMISDASVNELKDRYKNKRPLGKTYIEEGLKDIKIPSQQRNASKNSTGMTFGSKFPVKENGNFIRSAIWWTNSERNDNVDIDLALRVYDKDFNSLADVSYYALKNGDYAVHSGDIRDGGPIGGKGVAEFIDVDLKKLRKELPDSKYMVYIVSVYDGESFADTPCKFCWMTSKERIPQLFDMSKVEKAIELNAKSTRAIPALFDIDEEKYVWMDRTPAAFSDFKVKTPKNWVEEKNGRATNNPITYANSFSVEAMRALSCTSPNLYDLIKTYAEAKGEIVDAPESANSIFTVERADESKYPNAKEFMCAYDVDKILGDLISDELSPADKEYFKHEQEKYGNVYAKAMEFLNSSGCETREL